MAGAPERLREEFERERDSALLRLAAKERRDLQVSTIAGAAVGLAAVAATAGLTRHALHWHSFLLESLLCAVAGRLLCRFHGGSLKGVILFGGAYLAAWAIRAVGLDPSVLFAAGDLSRYGAVQGNFTSLCCVVATGGVLGHIFER